MVKLLVKKYQPLNNQTKYPFYGIATLSLKFTFGSMRSSITVLILLILSGICFALNSRAAHIAPMYVLIDSTNQLNATDVASLLITSPSRFQYFESGQVPNLGILPYRVWSVIPTKEVLKDDKALSISLVNPHIDSARFYVLTRFSTIDSVGLAGDKVPLELWPIKSPYPTVNIQLGQFATHLIISTVKNGSHRLPYVIGTTPELRNYEMKYTLFTSMYMGFLILSSILGVGFLAAYRNLAYLFYVFYTLSFFILMYIEFGYAYQFVQFSSPYDISFFRTAAGTINSISLVNFIGLFLGVNLHSKTLYKLIQLHTFFMLGQIVFFFAFPSLVLKYYYLIVPWYFFLLLVSTVLLLFSIIRGKKQFPKEAAFMALTYSLVIIGALTVIFLESKLLPHNNFTNYALAWSSALEMLMILGGISIRIKNEYQEKLLLKNQLIAEKQNQIIATINGEEQERKRLARELHDSIGSLLLAAKLRLAANSAADAQQIIQSAHTELRQISHQLLPPQFESQRLENIFENYLITALHKTKIQYSLTTYGNFSALTSTQKITLYRILQEAVTNTIRHAQAQEIHIEITQQSHQYVMTISDDGVGYDSSEKTANGIGMINMISRMEELKGSLSIETQPQKGVFITAQLPMAN